MGLKGGFFSSQAKNMNNQFTFTRNLCTSEHQCIRCLGGQPILVALRNFQNSNLMCKSEMSYTVSKKAENRRQPILK